MVKDEQVKMLMTLINKEKTLAVAAAKSGMTEKTARKYRDLQQLPSQVAAQHTWRTRQDPFEDDWPWVRAQLEINPGLEAKTLFEALQRDYPGQYQDGQLRTLQRRIKIWRATEGPAREVFFPQIHHPGVLCESDFTHMNDLGVMIAGVPFDHMIYHFVLTYSNWETGTICFSESFSSLSEGLQNALWQLGGVPQQHRTDRLSAAVHKPSHPEEFTQHYQALQNYYGFAGCKIQAKCPNENGDIEQSHHRFKRALDQALMLRGSRDFATVNDYKRFLQHVFDQLNAGRTKRLHEELTLLKSLPPKRLDDRRFYKVRVGRSSTINILNNTYSVHSRLIKEQVEVRVGAEHLEVWYAQKQVDRMPRLHGDGKHLVNYRHVIDWLVRKPGAFANYRYKASMFPTSNFRIAYDQLLKQHSIHRASKEYLRILHLAATESQTHVDRILLFFCHNDQPISYESVKEQLTSIQQLPPVTAVNIDAINLRDYDVLLERVI
jgi:hypothetical protein